MNSPLDLFRHEIETAGLRPGELIADGQIHRCPIEGKPQGLDGSYVLHLDNPPSGYWKNWKTQDESNWTAWAENTLSPAERQALQARIEADRQAREAEAAKRRAEGAQKAEHILAGAKDCQGHEYLARKGVSACDGLKVDTDGGLLVPIYCSGDSTILSLQKIQADGSKRFMQGGEVRGGFFPIPESDPTGPIFVVEGLATGLTVHAATCATVLCAFTAGNLEAVARYARANSQNRQIIVAGDNDTNTPGNPGRTAAEKAARAVNGLVVLPTFTDPASGTDFNDLAAVSGLDTVKMQIAKAGNPPREDAQPQKKGASVFQGLDLDKFKAGAFLSSPLPDLEWIFEDFLLTRNVCLLVGPPGTGKSFLSMQLAASISGGRGADGVLAPGVRGKVLVLAGEEDDRIVPRRLKALRDHFYRDEGPDLRAFGDDLHVVPLAGETLRLIEKTGAGAPIGSQVFKELYDLCMGIPNLRLIVVDPLSRAYGLDEQDNSGATVFITILEKLAQATGAGVLLLHHVNKNASTRKPNRDKRGYLPALEQEAARGASGFVGAVRAQINLVGLKKEEAQGLFGDSTAEDNHYLAIGFPKCSYGPPRPVLFLKREDNGVLVPIERPETVRVKQTRELIMEWITSKIRGQHAGAVGGFTRTTIKNYVGEIQSVVPMATRAEVLATVDVALESGELVITKRKNASGRQADFLDLPGPNRGAGEVAKGRSGRSGQNSPAISENSIIQACLRSGQGEKWPNSPATSKSPIISASVQSGRSGPLKREETADTSRVPLSSSATLEPSAVPQ